MAQIDYRFGLKPGDPLDANVVQSMFEDIKNFLNGKNLDATNINDGTITENLLGKDVIASHHIKNGAVTTEKLANGAVTGAKIANNTITDIHINTAANIGTGKLSSGPSDNITKIQQMGGTGPAGGVAARWISYPRVMKKECYVGVERNGQNGLQNWAVGVTSNTRSGCQLNIYSTSTSDRRVDLLVCAMG